MVEILSQEEAIDEGILPQHQKVTLVEGDNSLWGWQTETRGAFGFPSAEAALKHYQELTDALKANGF